MSFSKILAGFLKILSFIGVQYLFGKKGSYPYGLLLKFNLVEITILVIICDILQTLFLLYLLELSFNHIGFLKKIKEKLQTSEKKRSKFHNKLLKWGDWGLFFIAALPYAGGAISGSIVAYSLGMKKKKAFLIIVAGCILGAGIFYLSFSGILMVVRVK